MPESQERYVDADSYARGAARYEKTLSRWRNVVFAGEMTILLGLAIAGFFFSGTMNLGFSVMVNILFIGIGIAVLGAIPFAIGKHIFRRRKLDNFVYRIAVHFMHEMGIVTPEKILDENPRYLEAFEEVRAAVTFMEANNNGIGVSSQSLTPLSRRIGSLVLRDEGSLDLTAHLLSLMETRNLLDYDALAVLLDGKDTHHNTMTDGLL